MNRRGFLARAGGFVAALCAPRLWEATGAAEAVAEPLTLPSASVAGTGALTASGGLCAPIAPYYRAVLPDSLLRDALRPISAVRGGIEYPRS